MFLFLRTPLISFVLQFILLSVCSRITDTCTSCLVKSFLLQNFKFLAVNNTILVNMQTCEVITTVTSFSTESYALYDNRYWRNMHPFFCHFFRKIENNSNVTRQDRSKASLLLCPLLVMWKHFKYSLGAVKVITEWYIMTM